MTLPVQCTGSKCMSLSIAIHDAWILNWKPPTYQPTTAFLDAPPNYLGRHRTKDWTWIVDGLFCSLFLVTKAVRGLRATHGKILYTPRYCMLICYRAIIRSCKYTVQSENFQLDKIKSKEHEQIRFADADTPFMDRANLFTWSRSVMSFSYIEIDFPAPPHAGIVN